MYFIFLFYLVSEYMQVQQSAIKMLSSRVNIILQYVKAVKEGSQIHFFLNKISTICYCYRFIAIFFIGNQSVYISSLYELSLYDNFKSLW